jgi:hypothetical protein
MPLSKKREKKKRRDREGQPAAAPSEPSGGGGLLSGMRSGMKSVAGVGPKKPESLISKILTWALVAVAAYLLAKRFGLFGS